MEACTELSPLSAMSVKQYAINFSLNIPWMFKDCWNMNNILTHLLQGIYHPLVKRCQR